MRILYLSTSGNTGGAETSLLSVLEGLRDLHPEWEFQLITGEDGPLVSRAAELGVTVKVVPLPAELARLGEGSGNGIRGAFAIPGLAAGVLRYRRELSKAIRTIRPDVIHTNGFKMHVLAASIPAAGAGSARVCHMHDYMSGRRVGGALMKVCMGRFDAVVTNSKSVAADIIKYAKKYPLEYLRANGKISVIYNGIPMARFGREGARTDLDALAGLPAGPASIVRIGLPATFARWKGHVHFLRAIALLPGNLNIRAYIIGGPIYRTEGSQYTPGELREEANRLGLGSRVGFTGMVDDIAAAIRTLDVVVHASTKPEPFGMVIAEAMACGKPVIVSNAGGAAELFEDGLTGLAHTPGDTAALARQIERLVSDKELRLRLGENGYASVRVRFQASDMAKRFAELYLKVAGERKRAFPQRTQKQVRERCFVSD